MLMYTAVGAPKRGVSHRQNTPPAFLWRVLFFVILLAPLYLSAASDLSPQLGEIQKPKGVNVEGKIQTDHRSGERDGKPLPKQSNRTQYRGVRQTSYGDISPLIIATLLSTVPLFRPS